MFIVLHCGGMPFNGDTIKSESLGGSESAAYYMAKELYEKGHHVRIFTNHKDSGKFDGVFYEYCGEVSERYPLGNRFHEYAENVPADVLIIQRHPHAFRFKYASKINLWWVHDLALYRAKSEIQPQFMHVDGVLTVSEYHKKQVCEVYNINPDIVYPITNGIDLSLFEKVHDQSHHQENAEFESKFIGKVNLLYSSRPERGLENLVKPDGIMERLYKIDPKFHLYTCMYNNVAPHMQQYYAMLFNRIEELPNCTNLGSLTKQELADVMRQCDAMVYPTNFEEVSCITAMECMAAGLPFISSEHAALPETCKDSGSVLLSLNDGDIDLEAFVYNVSTYMTDENQREKLRLFQLKAATKYSWTNACNLLLEHVDTIFKKCQTNKGTMAQHFMRHSDIYALKYYIGSYTNVDDNFNEILLAKENELDECYRFMEKESWDEHYQNYYEYEKSKGVQYGYNGHKKENGREDVSGNSRFECVSSFVKNLKDGSTVLDYGCAHGHYTIVLARRFPNINFYGIDIAQSNIDEARKWADEEGLKNVKFSVGRVDVKNASLSRTGEFKKADLIIAAEVIEHLRDYKSTVDILCTYLNDNGKFLATTPYGPWEAIGYKKEWPWRAHVHHFEKQDLKEAFGHHPGYNVKVTPCGNAPEPIGSYVWSFDKPLKDFSSLTIDYKRKISQTVPSKQTVSLCMIVHDSEDTILKVLKKVVPTVDEVIIKIDENTTDRTSDIINKYMSDNWHEKPFNLHVGKSPLDIGFDEARNNCIKHASGDWILWIDSDEEVNAKNDYDTILRNNQFSGYAVAQHHFSAEPLGVLRTDYPCRLFRNFKGTKFYGRVHEHPETTFNKGIEPTAVIGNLEIIHPGYDNEDVRLKRFDRNINLLVKDREDYPDRLLGHYLWLRDLCQMTQREFMENGHNITNNMLHRMKEGIELFGKMLDMEDMPTRLLIDSIPFYSALVEMTGEGFEFGFKCDSSKMNGGLKIDRKPVISGHFIDKDHVDKLLNIIVKEGVKDYESRYF